MPKISEADCLGIYGRCAACGSAVSHYACNAALIALRPKAASEDWWAACDNADCPHHEGEGVFQDRASFELALPPEETYGRHLLETICARFAADPSWPGMTVADFKEVVLAAAEDVDRAISALWEGLHVALDPDDPNAVLISIPQALEETMRRYVEMRDA